MENNIQKISYNSDLVSFISTSASTEALSLIPEKLAKEIICLPISISIVGDNKILSIIVGENFDNININKLKFITNCEIITEVYEENRLIEIINSAYGLRKDYIHSKINSDFENEIYGKDKKSEIPNLLELIVKKAMLINASDIHIEPDKKGYSIRVRVDGKLISLDTIIISEELVYNLSRHIKVLSKVENKLIDTAIDGGFEIKIDNKSVRLRVSIIKLINGLKIVVRLLNNNDYEQKPDLSILGISQKQEQVIHCLLKMTSGTTIICGPTGSGKSTLLNLLASIVSQNNESVISVEDPVERIIKGINQIQVDRDNGESIHGILPSILRQDPDHIFIGEIRDANTAKVALEASLTGHKVFTTIHAKNSHEVKLRLKQFGLDKHLLDESISAIINQRLIPLLCENCKVKVDLHYRISPVIKSYGINDVWDNKGCDHCNHTGYKKRVGVYELDLIEFKNKISSKISKNKNLNISDLYTPIIEQIKNLVAEGKVSYKEIMNYGGIV